MDQKQRYCNLGASYKETEIYPDKLKKTTLILKKGGKFEFDMVGGGGMAMEISPTN